MQAMAVSCHACRLSALRVLAGTFWGRFPGSVRAPFRPVQAHQVRTRFSTFRRSLPLRREPAIRELREEAEQAPAGNDADALSTSDGTEPEVPWFLDVEPPRHPTLMYEPAPLPDVPEGAPNVMAPLIKFVAGELGLDELNLLDLRELDPPSALGPELFMLFGSARSERHLHVAADRLVRWLRGQGVSASADGVLGRRELKVKLRRKARKAKLLGKSGVHGESDDGISTGWVCVNLGTIGCSDKEVETFDEKGEPVGFRIENSGATVAVQMFVDHRREEVALEKLWQGKLKRSLERKTIPSRNPERLEEPFGSSTSVSVGGYRAFSTWARRMTTAAQVDSMAVMDETLMDHVESKTKVLEQLRRYLATLPPKDAVAVLTTGQGGTPWTRLFERAVENLPPQTAREWRCWLEVESASRAMGHSNLDLASLQSVLRRAELENVRVSREHYLGLLRAIYAKPGEDNEAVRRQSEVAMEVIKAMFARGFEVLEHDVMVTVMESLLQSGGAHGAEAERMLSVFEHLLTHANLPCPSADQLIRLLDGYATCGLWDKFWAVWRIPARFCVARTPEMYTYLFRRFAADKHQIRCIEALRWCVPEMKDERPPVVPQGALLEAVKDCVRVADPQAERLAGSLVLNTDHAVKLARREFVKLLRELGVKPE